MLAEHEAGDRYMALTSPGPSQLTEMSEEAGWV